MLSCKEVTHLLSEAQDRKITLPERVNLEMHLAMCKGCKNFKSQKPGKDRRLSGLIKHQA